LRVLPYEVREKTHEHARTAERVAEEACCFMTWVRQHCDIIPMVYSWSDKIEMLYLNVTRRSAVHFQLGFSFCSIDMYDDIVNDYDAGMLCAKSRNKNDGMATIKLIDSRLWEKAHAVCAFMREILDFASFLRVLRQHHVIVYNLISMSRSSPTLLCLGQREVLDRILHEMDADESPPRELWLLLPSSFTEYIRSQLPHGRARPMRI